MAGNWQNFLALTAAESVSRWDKWIRRLEGKTGRGCAPCFYMEMRRRVFAWEPCLNRTNPFLGGRLRLRLTSAVIGGHSREGLQSWWMWTLEPYIQKQEGGRRGLSLKWFLHTDFTLWHPHTQFVLLSAYVYVKSAYIYPSICVFLYKLQCPSSHCSDFLGMWNWTEKTQTH